MALVGDGWMERDEPDPLELASGELGPLEKPDLKLPEAPAPNALIPSEVPSSLDFLGLTFLRLSCLSFLEAGSCANVVGIGGYCGDI